ncbi:MAG: ABC transporter permease [Tannerellaceae bacterium]|nr:ABC transporter permease [Tannerellaceae bacterium]
MYKVPEQNKSYSFINVFGLAISLMFILLITIYTTQELSRDKFHEKGDQVYAMDWGNMMIFSYLLGEKLKSSIPEIQEVSPVNSIITKRVVQIEDRIEEIDFLVVAPTFFDFFSFPLLVGSKENAFKDKTYALVSESFAQRAFAGKDPLGQTIKIDDNVSVVVNGVIADIKNSAIHYGDILISHETASQIDECIMSEGCWGTSIYMMLPKQADVRAVEEKIRLFMNELQDIKPEQEDSYQVSLVPLKELYFSPLNPGSYWFYKGDRAFVVILISIGCTILLFAIINYINLTVAQNGFRAKEMAVRSLLGSSRFELFSRMVTESTLVCFISFLLGFLLLFSILPAANQLLQTTIDVGAFLSPVTISLLIRFIVLMGLVTGLLPAIIISKARPIEVVKGTFRKQTKVAFSKFFITFQNTITIILVAVSITMIWQTSHMVNAPLGFKKDNLIYIATYGWSENNPELAKTLINELNQLACVNWAVGAQGTPIDGGSNRGARINGQSVRFQILTGNDDYFDMLGIQIIKENNLAGTFGYYINEHVMQLASIDENALEIKTDDGWNSPIAGIVKNFHMENISRGLDPVLLEKSKLM